MSALKKWARRALLVFCFCISIGMPISFALIELCKTEPAVMWAYRQQILDLSKVFIVFPIALFVFLLRFMALQYDQLREKLKNLPLSFHAALYSGVITVLVLSAVGVCYYDSCAHFGWARGVGQVTSVETKSMGDPDSIVWKFDYTYRVDGIDHCGTCFSFCDAREMQWAGIRRMRTTKDGKERKEIVRVFYDPTNPDRSRLWRRREIPIDWLPMALALSMVAFTIYSLYIFQRVVECVERQATDDFRCSEMCPETLPSLQSWRVAFVSGAVGFVLAYGILSLTCGESVLVQGVPWIGLYVACLFGAMCAAVGTALRPTPVSDGQKGGVPKTVVLLSAVALAGFFFASINNGFASVIGDLGGPFWDLGLFLVLLMIPAFAMTALGLFVFRFKRGAYRELVLRGMTLKRYIGRMLVHMSTVAALGFLGYELLILAFRFIERYHDMVQ